MTMQAVKPELTYRHQDGLYINLTNYCPTACKFCIKFTWKMKYRGHDLRLFNQEPAPAEFVKDIEKAYAERPFKEIVFCGYGESTYRLKEMTEICDAVKARLPKVSRRLNTIGLGNLIKKRSIAKDLEGHLDAVSVSLNTADPKQWAQIHNPKPEFKARGFESVLEFIRECAQAVPDTTVTAVGQPGINVKAVKTLTLKLGAKFRERSLLDKYEAA